MKKATDTSATVLLRAGRLEVDVSRAELSLESLCGFGSRRSRKRGFVFVSKVLGKHYPVKPTRMAEVQRRLADKVADLPGPIVFLGLAETATALSQGVFEQVAMATGRDDLLFLHSTRYRLGLPLALSFQESHSHASDHLVHEPNDEESRRIFRNARSLVLIDDELSTGATLLDLAQAYLRVNAKTRAVHFVCITDWLGTDRRRELACSLARPIYIHSLLEGSYHFAPNPDFDPGPVPTAVGDGSIKEALLAGPCGRTGIRDRVTPRPEHLAAFADLKPGARILVLGTGEFAYPPFRLALELERQGHDVRYQSTTRSPLLVDGEIRVALESIDNYGDRIPNYLYNVRAAEYDRIALGYETDPLPSEHALPALLGAKVLFFR